jgi:hypothetical protein
MACAVAGLIFQRFWSVTRDRLFFFFALAFWILGVERLVLVIVEPQVEARHWVFVLRLCAYLLIVWAIIDKNRRGRSG